MRKLFTFLFVASLILSMTAQDFVDSPFSSTLVAESTAVADFDGDGFEDVLAAVWKFGPTADLYFYRNTKETPIRFEKIALDKTVEMWALSIPLDYDGDGDMDILYSNRSDLAMFAYDNDGLGKFTIKPLGVKGSGVHLVGDMNGDNIVDIVGQNVNDELLDVYTRSATGTYTKKNIALGNFNPKFVRLADTDNDGDLDIILMNSSFNDQMAVMVNNGQNSYTKKVTLKDSWPFYNAMTTGDINNDGRVDVIALGNYEMTVNINKGNNTFEHKVIDEDFELKYSSVGLADLNGDGKMDVVAGDNNKGIFWFKNTDIATSKFEKIKISSISQSVRLGFADLEKDGDKDIVANSLNLYWVTNNVKQETSSLSESAGSNIHIYPNPMYHEVTINGLEGDGYEAVYYNMAGIQVLTTEIIKNTSNVQRLESGIYILQVQDNKGQTFVSKMVVKE